MSVKEMTRTARAFVFLEVQLGKEQKVMEELLKFPEVKEVHEITGEDDIIAVLDTPRDILVPTTQKIADFVSEKIGKIHGIKDTETIIPTKSKIKV